MDIIEVDPKLFVTCRLCLEEMGQFQLVPSVAQQIKYCFDIDVEPFDGLPQLICFKCKEVLNKFHTVKTTFCDKQAQLKIRVLKKEGIPLSQHNAVSSSQQNQLNSSDTTAGTITSKSKTKRVIQSSSSSDEAEPEQIPKTKSKKRRVLTRNKVMEWEKDYKKEIVCKICNSHWPKKTSYTNHFRSHDALISKFKNIFSKPCRVILEKFDGKPNVTGVANIVVLSTNKIIKFGDTHFHTVYSRDAFVDENFIENNIDSKPSYETNLSQNLNYDGVDDEIVMKRKSRSLRLLSKSSNDTVVLENNDKNETSDNDYDSRTASQCSDERPVAGNDICISIDDSESDSNSGNLDSGQRVKQPIEAKFGDYKIIQGIISMCVNAYQKKNEGADIDTYINVMRNKKDKTQVSNESQLKHKLLSIGRKIINKQGFNCTGLLRFMEHKNLEILWITKPLPLKTNKDTNYIRILTKLRENATPDDSWWKHITENTELDVSSPDENILSEAARTSIYECKNSEQDTITSEKKLDEPKIIENVQQNVLNKQTEVDNLPAVLYLSTNNASNQPKKILNANPVANPKLLPKKTGQCNERASRPPATNQNVCQIDSEQAKFSMPIITSTHSLATGTIEEQKEVQSAPPAVAPNIETPAPRIKVKPASELMSERILNSIRNDKTASASVSNILSSPNVWPHQQPINVFVPNMSPPPVTANEPLQLVQIPCMTLPSPYQEMAPKQTANSQRDQIILDTIEFPNTKTESPFKYFEDLLQVHNLVLLHPCGKLSRNFYCLIKFKVLFKKETKKDKPVVLCLSLFCYKNNFCLKIKDGSQQNIDIGKISAHWQWEILQIYCGEVVKRILENAQKISHEQYAYAMNFFCLLKSICKKIG